MTQLRSWGFNSLGPFTDTGTFASLMPYSVQLSMASGNDWFAASFATHADQVAASQVAPLANDRNLIGWYTDSELRWGPDINTNQPLLDDYLALPAGSPGLAVAQQYVGNPNGFVYALATRYFQVTTAAVRMYDPNHLILGVKAEGQYIQPELLEAASHYVDVFSIDDYQLQPGFAQGIDGLWPQYLPVTPTFSNFEQYLGSTPIMVAEYSFIAKTPQTPNTVPGVLAVYPDQPARAAAYTDYVAPLYENAPWVVGDEWFEYVDEPQGGRFDGENNNFGVVDVENQPYQDLVTQLEIMHSIAPDRAYQTGPTCDSWASGPSGVTCTATMAQASYPLSIFSTSLPGATQGTPYANYVVAIGGSPGYTFTLPPGQSLPAGLQLSSSSGLVSGNPSVSGTFAFTINVSDSTNPASQTASQQVSLTIGPEPFAITTQPQDQTVTSGQTATFSAVASGAPTPTVQWQLSVDGGATWGSVAGLTSPSFTSGPVTWFENGWKVRAVFTNSAGSVTSNPATLTVVARVAPSITTQPQDQTVTSGQTATFSAVASGAPTPTVQWQLSVDGGATWGSVAGLTSPSFTSGPVTWFENGWKVRAVFTNSAGSVTSNPATLTVVARVAPSITTQPQDQTVTSGQTATFSAVASGAPTPTVQWQLSVDGGATWGSVAGLTSPSFTSGPVTWFENGWKVRAVFTNSAGSVTSNPATLTVVQPAS